MLVREIEAAVRRPSGPARSRSAVGDRSGAGAGEETGRAADSGATSVALGGASGSGAFLVPSDERQISAPPLATSTSGQTIASENQIPSARKINRALSSSSPVPSATSTAARPVGTPRGETTSRVAPRDEQPAERVGHQAQAAGRRGDHEAEAHEPHVDAVAARDAGGHAAEPAALAIAPEQPAAAALTAGGRRVAGSGGAHRSRLRPRASRIAPVAAQATGANTAKVSSKAPVASRSSRAPRHSTAAPPTSDAISGLAARTLTRVQAGAVGAQIAELVPPVVTIELVERRRCSARCWRCPRAARRPRGRRPPPAGWSPEGRPSSPGSPRPRRRCRCRRP